MYQTFLKPLLKDINQLILDTLFPICCLSCDKEGAFICGGCKASMKAIEHQRCIVCQRSAPFGFTHPKCQTPYSADCFISFYDYHDKKVSKIIIGGKYKFISEVYVILGQMISSKIKNDYSYLLPSTNYTLVPVPLHKTRRRWRGFNQAEILCQTISQELGASCASVLVRSKMTKTQKNLKKDQRLKNIKNAFAVSPLFSKDGVSSSDEALAKLEGSSFILVDDVATTGGTLQEAVKVLKRNGAAKVICLTIARD